MPDLRPLLVALALPLGGCAHRVALDSAPSGARVAYRGSPRGVAPSELQVLWLPFRKMEVEVSLVGYRDLTIDLQGDVGPVRLLGELLRPWKWDRWWGGEVRTHHELQLVRVHGRAGTWTPDDARR